MSVFTDLWSNGRACSELAKQVRPIKSVLSVMLAVATAAAAVPVGTWRLNVDKSRYEPGAPQYKSFMLTLASAENGAYRVTVKGELADGTPVATSYLLKSDGKDYPVTNAPFDSIAVVEEKPNVSIITMKRQGKIIGKTRSVVVGNVMTQTTDGVSATGKPYHAVGVMEKQ